jgi:hypothetical protein
MLTLALNKDPTVGRDLTTRGDDLSLLLPPLILLTLAQTNEVAGGCRNCTGVLNVLPHDVIPVMAS